MLTVPEAIAAMRDYLDERVTNLARAFDRDDADARGVLTVCAIFRIAVGGPLPAVARDRRQSRS